MQLNNALRKPPPGGDWPEPEPPFPPDPPEPVSYNDAQFIAQTVTSPMVAGQAYDVSVTMRNTGNETWTPQGLYRLGAQDPQDNTRWGLGRVDVPGAIAPGQDATFRFRITAPTAAGTHSFQWRMLREGVEWFGAYATAVPVAVQAPPVPGVGIDEIVDQCGLLPAVVSSSVALEPARQRNVDANGVNYQVTEQRFRDVTDVFEHAFMHDIAQLGVWPGEIIQGRSLLNGDVAPVGPLKRMPGTVSIATDVITNTPGPQSMVVDSPTGAAVDAVRRSMLQALNPTDAPGLLRTRFQRANTYREAGLKLGFAVKGAAFEVDANAALNQTYKKTTVVASIRHAYYSVTFRPHAARASGIWSERDLREQDLRAYVGAGNPPLCIDSVQYGRFICVAVQGAYSSEDITAAVRASWTAAVSGNGSIDARFRQILENSEVNIYTMGVPGRGGFQSIDDPADLQQVYRAGLVFNRDNPGAPISFTARHIADGTLAHVALAAEYVKPLDVRGVDVRGARYSVWDGAGGGLVDTGLTANPGDTVKISATGEIWSGVWGAGTHGPEGWPGHTAHPAAPLKNGTAYCLIHKFGSSPEAPWLETGPFWQGSPSPGAYGGLQLNVNDNKTKDGDKNKKWTVTVDIARASAGAAGVYI